MRRYLIFAKTKTFRENIYRSSEDQG